MINVSKAQTAHEICASVCENTDSQPGGKEGPFLSAVIFFVLLLSHQSCLYLYVPTYELKTVVLSISQKLYSIFFYFSTHIFAGPYICNILVCMQCLKIYII